MKPMIRYNQVILPPVVGQSAVVRLAEAHHSINETLLALHRGVVTTSTVQSVEEGTGRFETRNTLYVPDERPAT